jgi:hypothetical protein
MAREKPNPICENTKRAWLGKNRGINGKKRTNENSLGVGAHFSPVHVVRPKRLHLHHQPRRHDHSVYDAETLFGTECHDDDGSLTCTSYSRPRPAPTYRRPAGPQIPPVPTKKSVFIESVELAARRGRVQWNVGTLRFPAPLPSWLSSNSGRSAR